MPNKKIKELEQTICDLLKEKPRNHKQHALTELELAEKLAESHNLYALDGTHFYTLKYIVDDYPDYDHIQFKIFEPGRFECRIIINVNDLKDNPKAIHATAKMLARWAKNKKQN